MKILWLYQYMPLYNFDHHLHMSFAKVMSCHPGVQLYAYGPCIQEGYPNLSLIKYDPNLTMSDLHNMFAFDVCIVNTKSRCFTFYSPLLKRAEGCWLPKDFSTWTKTKKIMIEEDYHYETDDLWYKEMNFDLLIQRHYSQSLREEHVPMHFLPFSVDTGVFNPWNETCVHGSKVIPLIPHNKRLRSFAFVGNDADKAYNFRKAATTKLCDEKLGVSYTGSKKVDGEYVEVLRKYFAYVSCGSIYDICAGKNFEIIASGGILFTNKFLGIDLILPPNCYVSYKNDCSDVIEQAKHLLNDHAYAKHIQENALQWITEYHTHEIRIKQLIQLLS